MRKLFVVLLMLSLLPSCFALGDRWDLIFSDGTTTINGTDVCLTSGKCLSTSVGGGDITAVNTAGNYLTGGDITGAISLLLNETYLNLTITAIASASGSDNSSWNQTYADTLFIAVGDEANLNVNSSDYWDNVNLYNETQMNNNAGTLDIDESWFATLWNTILGTKDTDDLTEGSANLYDNSTWNETHANTKYALIGAGADNSSWNQTYADSLYLPHTIDTSASVDCATTEVLLGNGSCYNSTLFYDNTDTDTLGDVGACNNEQVVKYNTTSAGWECEDVSAAGAGDIDAVNTDGNYLTGGQSTGTVDLLFNETLMNNTNDLRYALLNYGDDWNKTYADTLYADIGVTGGNASWNETYATTLYADISITGDNSSWNKTYADTQYADISVVDTNETSFVTNLSTTDCSNGYLVIGVQANGTVLCSADTTGAGGKLGGSPYLYNDSASIFVNETYLNETIDDRDADTTYTAGGNLTLTGTEFILNGTEITSWLDGIYQAIGTYLTSAVEVLTSGDNYIELNASSGSVEITLNETYLNATINLLATGDNESWNETYADTIYAPVNYGDDWNETYADTLYVDINGDNMTGDLNNTGNITANDFIIPEMTGNNGAFTINHFFSDMTSAGRLTGGDIVTDAGTSVIVTSGEGLLRDLDDDHSQVRYYEWVNSSAISIPTDSIMYFGIDLNGGSPIVVNYTTDDNFDLDTSFPLGTVINQGGDLHILNNPWWVGDGLTNIIERFQAEGWLERDDNRGGLILGYTGTRNPTMTAGTLWSRLTEHEFSDFDSSGTDTFDAYYRDGSGSYTKVADQTQWNNTHYDDGTGTLTPYTLGGGVIWVWANVATDEIALMYPQAQYSSLAQAEAETIPDTYPGMWYKGGVIIGRIIVQDGVDTPIEVQSSFTTTFTASLAADHGNLAGLSDDDHTQYLLVDGTRNQTTLDVTNNITAQYYFGDASELTGITGDGVDNSSWNETYATTLFIEVGEEGDLNVNSSDYWDNLETINTTQMENNGGTLNILISWFSSYFDTLFSAKDTDDLTEGSTNLYDNSSWNESWADTQYADVSVTGDNSTWNESHADTLYAPVNYGDDWNKTYADTLYADISVTGDNSSWNETYATTLYADISVVDTDSNLSESDVEGYIFDNDNTGNLNTTGNIITTEGNITVYEDNYICLNVDCSSYILNNGTHLILK